MNYQRSMALDPAGTIHRITGEPAIPIERRGRVVWLSRRQIALATYVARERRFSLRDAAARLGYSVSGLRRALDQLTRLRVIAVTRTRGRYGSTVARLLRGWRRRVNVRSVIPSGLILDSLNDEKDTVIDTQRTLTSAADVMRRMFGGPT